MIDFIKACISLEDKDGHVVDLSGTDLYVTDFNIDVPRPYSVVLCGKDVTFPPERATVTMTFHGPANKIIQTFYDNKPKISDKKVKDCSIQELLFAVRSKI